MKALLPRLALVMLLGLPSLAAAERPERQLRVVALNTVLAEIVREVGDDWVVVNGLVRPGVDPHTFEPSAADLRAMVDADLVLASGLQLESYLDRLVAKIGPAGRVVVVGDALPSVLSLAGGEKDPHWWHSIDNVLFATDLVQAELTRLRPARAAEFVRNAQSYRQQLLALKTWVATELATLPPARRQLVTSHDAFGYFARDYGFTIHPIAGLSTDAEPDARHLANLIDLLRREHIRAVFAESSVNSNLVANLVAETGVRLGGTLCADGLGPADSDAATYEAMYRHNVRTIIDALR
ncbi:MAG: metal ABC transporter solute-binding protein, Zn/Mn family [Opitutales bacterium]